MPKELTHWIVAEEALNRLHETSRIRRLLCQHHSCYLVGAVLPDTMLHPVRGSYGAAMKQLAEQFHNTSGNSFEPFINQELRGETLSSEQLACQLGVLTHVCADIIFHPFVYAGAGLSDIGRHYSFETALDCAIQQSGYIPPVKRLADCMSPPVKTCAVLTCSRLFDPHHSIPHHALHHAVDRHVSIQSLYDRISMKIIARLIAFFPASDLGKKSGLFYPLRLPAKVIIPGNGCWIHPFTGEKQQSTVQDLVTGTIEKIIELFRIIEAADMCLPVLAEYPGENLLTGMPGKTI